ncbi:MAG: hypothetical protein KGH60_03805 [Candidatus Micrarchaeota archaeon]|nr:hypothetical protein [Candidatus Micrarchaeota archaeon]
MERISKSGLLGFLDVFDREAGMNMLLVAVGGTAMTLLGLKPSTKDIDFNIPSDRDLREFRRLRERMAPGVKIDVWGGNMIFTERMPDDYIKRSSEYSPGKFKKIRVMVLSPMDIVCSKISRLNDADIEDIKDCIKLKRITKRQLKARANQFSRAGNDQIFAENLEYILKEMF